MKRRDFIQNTVAGSAFLASGIPLSSFSIAPKKHLTVLHTNDVHSHVDPFPATDPRNPNMGGVARRAALIENIRIENPNVLLLDAGDIFQGTPYFNYYGGEIEFKLMSMMKYDAATLGNHDFDNGIEGFYAQLPHATFDFVSANYDFSKTNLAGLVKPYKVYNKGGIKVGVFGLGIELAGLVDPLMYKETVYLDPVEISQDIVKQLKNVEKCDIIIALSHLGYKYNNDLQKISDVKLAALTQDIDLIIGGHTHTFLKKPTILENAAGKEVLINQTGCFGLNLGRIDFYLDTDAKLAGSGRSITI